MDAFEHARQRIEADADDIGRVIDDVASLYSPQTLARFRECQAALKTAAKMLYRVDCLLCQYDSEERFNQLWDDEVN